MLGEKVQRSDWIASVVIAVGCTLAIAFGSHDTKQYEFEELMVRASFTHHVGFYPAWYAHDMFEPARHGKGKQRTLLQMPRPRGRPRVSYPNLSSHPSQALYDNVAVMVYLPFVFASIVFCFLATLFINRPASKLARTEWVHLQSKQRTQATHSSGLF